MCAARTSVVVAWLMRAHPSRYEEGLHRRRCLCSSRGHGLPHAVHQPVAESVDPLPGTSAGQEVPHPGMDDLEVVEQFLELDVDMREQIDLVDHGKLTSAKHERYFSGLSSPSATEQTIAR